MRLGRLALVFAFTACCVLPSLAQSPATSVSDINASGARPFGSLTGNDFEYVDANNGGLNARIPLVTKKGRGGLDFELNLTYSSKFWNAVNDPTYGGHMVLEDDGTSSHSVGWDTAFLNLGSSWSSIVCYDPNNPDGYELGFVFHDQEGTKHPFQNQTPVSCASGYPRDYSVDMTGLMLKTPMLGSPPTSPYTLYLPNGVKYKFKSTQPVFLFYIPDIEDANGNQITSNYVVGPPNGQDIETWTDSAGAIVAVRKFGGGPNGKALSSVSYTDSNGNLQSYTFTWTTTPIICNFQHPQPCLWTQGSITVLSQITLPSGLSYRFGYNDTSGNPNPGGELMRIDLPSGGYIRYEYQTLPNGENSDGAGPADSRVVTKRVHSADGVHEDVWLYSYTRGTQKTTTVTDPLGNLEVYTFDYLNSYESLLAFETRHQFFQGSTTLIKQIDQSYQYDNVTCLLFFPDCSGTGNVDHRVVSRTVTWPQTNQVSQTTYAYDQFSFDRGTLSRGNVIQTQEYDYGTGSPGALLRTTVSSPLTTNPINGVDYTSDNFHIWRKPSSEVVHTGSASGPVIAQTQYEYDNYTEGLNSSGATQHDSANGTGYTTRGNLTAVKRWRNTDGVWLTTRNQYDDAGNVRKITDPLLHSTMFGYADSWGNNACAPSSGNAAAYATSVTNALSQVSTSTYNSCSGTLASAKDVNNLTTTHTYEILNRRIQSNFPDAGQGTACFSEVSGSTCYSSSLPLSVTQTQKINSTLTKTSKTIFDGLGRAIQTQLTSDPQGTVFTDTTYDSLGRVALVSNPYRQGTDPTSSPGTTMYAYDALDRKTSETYPDGSVLTTAYCGATTLVTDPTRRWRRSTTDALGRLIEVDEPNAIGATVASSGCPGTGEPIWITTYTYDTLGNLTQVVQNGSHQRSFTYNSVSQLLTSTNPEVGAITYTYDAAGNVATKNDARNITTTYGYDALNRLQTTSYSNGDPTITTTYDQANCLGLSACQNIGQRTSVTDAAGSEAWAYQVDATNFRTIHVNQRTTNGTTNTSTYYLDLAGNPYQIIYPTGRTVNYTYNAANRPIAAIDGSNGITYATDFQTAPTGCLSGAVCYTPQSTFYALSIGQSSTFTGLNLTHTYNNRLQPNEFTASSSGGNAIDIAYNFVDPVTTHNAGHVYTITNNLDSTRSQTFAYDQLSRITSALTASTYATSPAHCWGESYTLDAWGNLNSIATTTNSNYTGCTVESGFSSTADGNNHLPAWAYDASGNATGDGVDTYYLNGESQLQHTGGAIFYGYDGDGRRVTRGGGCYYVNPSLLLCNNAPTTTYWYGSGSEVLAETGPGGYTTAEYIFFGGKRIAMIPWSGSPGFPTVAGDPIYYVEDMLGTSRVVTTNTGVVCYDADFYPYGGERTPYTNNCPATNNYKFEGKERDTETGNDDFGARYYSNRFGRWLSADWSAVPVAVPYANLTNPQTLNLYSMVADDPESFADLDGHCDPGPGCVLLILEVVNRFADNPVGFVKSFLFGAVKQELSTVRDNIGLKPAPELNPSNDVERAGAATTEAGQKAAAVILPFVTGGEGEEPGGSFMGPKEGSSGGPGAGKDFSPATMQDAVNENATANGGPARCVFCGEKVTNEPGPNKVNIDHAQAKANNGNSTLENANVTCQYCNQSKGTGPAPKNPKPKPEDQKP